jgi:hypothetical protein
MKRLLILTLFVGCQTPKPIDDSAWKQALLSADRAVQSTVTSTHEVVTENTKQLEAIAQSIEAIKQATETPTDSEEVIPVSTELTQDDREEVISYLLTRRRANWSCHRLMAPVPASSWL